MKPLDKIIKLFHENGIPIPAPEHVAQTRTIDESLEGTDFELSRRLHVLEERNKHRWALGLSPSWSSYRGTPFAKWFDQEKLADKPIPSKRRFFAKQEYLLFTKKDIVREHRRRLAEITEILSDKTVAVEDGGLKSPERARNKAEWFGNGDPQHCNDLSRLRVVVPGLDDLEIAYMTLQKQLRRQQISFSNFYCEPGWKYDTPYRAVMSRWCGFDENSAEDLISTEVQIVTCRTRAVMDWNHPFEVSRKIQYPDYSSGVFVNSLILKASILDFQERFPGSY